MSKLIALNKPYGVLSQFTSAEGDATLAELVPMPGIYAAGRLDKDSEGLLLLTDNGRVQHAISHPSKGTYKTYWVQVEGVVSDMALESLAAGVSLNDGITLPARVRLMPEPSIWPRNPPVRFRKEIPTSWLEISIREGRNRQVRRMTGAVGFPTLRLIRVSVGAWVLGDLLPGQFRLLFIPDDWAA